MWNNGLKKSNSREAWLDIAKCFAIVLVVLNHMNRNIPVITFFGGMFYMPVFFVATGYTYRNKGEGFWKFAKAKAKRLLLPYAGCNLVLFALFTLLNRGFSKPAFLGMFYSRSMLMAADSSWNMALMPYLNAPTWFLTCIFLCLCIYFLIDNKIKDTNKRRLVVALAVVTGIGLRTISPVLLPWSLENALYFLGLVELGRFLKDGGASWLEKNPWIYANFLLIFLTLSMMNGSVNVSISQYGRSMAVYFVVGALGSLLCMKAAQLTEQYAKPVKAVFTFVGRHTMPILCWHLLVIEVVGKVLPALGIK